MYDVTNFRVFKLVTGEEWIGCVLGYPDSETVELYKPMKLVYLVDDTNQVTYMVMKVSPWIDAKRTKLRLSHVVATFEASEVAESMYFACLTKKNEEVNEEAAEAKRRFDQLEELMSDDNEDDEVEDKDAEDTVAPKEDPKSDPKAITPKPDPRSKYAKRRKKKKPTGSGNTNDGGLLQ